MRYTPIVGTLGYVVSPDQQCVLLVHRTARYEDDHYGKYNGLGGKMHPDEDVETCMKREILEEAGITCHKMSLRGTINWTNFGPNQENWLGFIFRIDSFFGAPYKKNTEGELSWVPLSKLMSLPLWEGDRYFLPLIFDENPTPFHGCMPYQKDKVLGWSYQR